jgi:hypothetical protein
MKQKLYLAIFILLISAGCTPNSREDQVKGIFISEPLNPRAVLNANDWSLAGSDLNAAWGSTNVRYQKDYIPQEIGNTDFELTGWKNERVNAQLVLWSADTIENIEIDIQIVGEDGVKFPENVINHYYLRNLITDEFLNGCGARDKDTATAHLVADAFERIEVYSHPSASTRGVWITVDIPEDLKAGLYQGRLDILVNGKTQKELGFNLNVQDKLLPNPGDWAFHLDLWQNPYSLVRTENVELWSEEHFQVIL